MERIVLVAYKPFPGRGAELETLLKSHWQILRDLNLVSDRKSMLMKASDGTIIEAFGWKSSEAIQAAHENIVVQEMWSQYGEICEYIPVSEIGEAQKLFSEFHPIN